MRRTQLGSSSAAATRPQRHGSLSARARARKPSWGGLTVGALPIAFLMCALLMSGCSVGTGELSVTPVSMREHSTRPGSEADARRALDQALAATGGEYRYETTVTIDHAVTTRVSGAVSGVAQKSTIKSGGSVVEYLRTANGDWVMGPADGWVGAGVHPNGEVLLEALARPDAVGVSVGGAGNQLVLDVVYGGESVGAPDVDAVEVRVTISDGVVSHVSYVVPVGGSTAEVVTVIRDVGEVGDITGRDLAGEARATR